MKDKDAVDVLVAYLAFMAFAVGFGIGVVIVTIAHLLAEWNTDTITVMKEIEFKQPEVLSQRNYNIYSVDFNGGERLSDDEIYNQAAKDYPQLMGRQYAMGRMVVFNKSVDRDVNGGTIEVTLAWYD